MNDRVADFAETYSKMTDEQLLRVLSDEKSLVDAARAALQAEVQRRDLASPADTGNALRGQTETLWERQLNPEGVGGWLALWCVSVALIGPLYFFFHASEQIAQTSLTLVMFGSQSWVGVVSEVVLGLQFVTVLYSIATVLCVFAVKPYALKMVFIYFLLWAAVEALACVLIVLFVRVAGTNLASDAVANEAMGAAVGSVLRDLTVLGVWFIYFKRSKRVRNTFGRNI